MDTEQAYLESALEAILFVSADPVPAKDLAQMLEIQPSDAQRLLEGMAAERQQKECGIQLRQVASGWQLVTHPEHHGLIERCIRSWDSRKLSQAAMETLAIVAYMQPVTRAQISSVRGVASDSSVSSLIEKGLVREAGTSDAPGNPILYGTTRAFLDAFGLKSIDDLTDLAEFAPDEETERLIRERLSATREEISLTDDEAKDLAEQMLYDDDAEAAIAGMVAADAQIAAEDAADALTRSAEVDPLRKMMQDALASTADVVEKIDFSVLKFDTDDE